MDTGQAKHDDRLSDPSHPLFEEWKRDCMRWRGRILTGNASHWCDDWDGLPVDESTPDEYDFCHCNLGED